MQSVLANRIIRPIDVAASSFQGAGGPRLPEYTITDIGLSFSYGQGFFISDDRPIHSTVRFEAWESEGTQIISNQWIMFDLGEKLLIAGMVGYNRQSTPSGGISNVVIYASTNNDAWQNPSDSSWSKVFEGVFPISTGGDQGFLQVFDQSGYARYIMMRDFVRFDQAETDNLGFAKFRAIAGGLFK